MLGESNVFTFKVVFLTRETVVREKIVKKRWIIQPSHPNYTKTTLSAPLTLMPMLNRAPPSLFILCVPCHHLCNFLLVISYLRAFLFLFLLLFRDANVKELNLVFSSLHLLYFSFLYLLITILKHSLNIIYKGIRTTVNFFSDQCHG